MAFNNNRVAVVIPAHNERGSITKVVRELAELVIDEQPLIDDIVVCDNDSSDETAQFAQQAGARVIYEPLKGYGAACLSAIKKLHNDDARIPKIVIFVDGDYSVKSDEVFDLLAAMKAGADLVVGSRVNERLHKGALGLHQRFGNFLASALISVIWRKQVSDLGPFRAINFQRLLELDMQDKAFGWTVEMQVKAIQAGFTYVEVPVTTKQRIGISKISGTLRGTIGAAIGIFGMVFKLYRNESEFVEAINRGHEPSNVKL